MFLKILKDYFNKFINYVYGIFLNKKRAHFLNSYKSDEFLKNFFKNSLNYKKIPKIFYNNKIFAYSDIKQKEKIIELLELHSSSKIKQFLDYAEKIATNEFLVFERNYRFKNQVDWHYSFFNDYNWEIKRSEKINLHPGKKNVDVKYVWELNRHQFLPYLGFAYYYTKNEKYAELFKKIILDWIKKNPPLYGINWNSGLEVSIRLISWIFSLFFFEDLKIINNENFFRKIFKSMFQHAFYLRYFTSHRGFNHSIGAIFGLYLFSKIFDKIKKLRKWVRKYYKKFKLQILLQTRTDGTNIEQSVNYHRFVLEFFSLFLILEPETSKCEKEGILIEKMYDYLLYIIKPNGKFPMIGDSDEGKAILLTYYEKNLFYYILNLGSILFKREDLKFISEKIHPISILLLGVNGYKVFKELQAKEPNNLKKYFKEAGYIAIRNNWSKKANYLFIDFAKFGPLHSAHTHSGLTNIVFCCNGKNIINDSGTYRYNESWEERNLFRGNRAHNILTINNQDQSNAIDWYKWKGKPQIKRFVSLNREVIRLVCIHDAYKGFLVERKLITNKNLNSLVIKDKITSYKRNKINEFTDINIFLHFDYHTELNIENKTLIIDNNLKIENNSKYEINVDLENFYYSPTYGIKYECKMLNIHLKHRFKENESIEITTKVLPLSKK